MAKLTAEEILNDIKTRPAVPVWPHNGWANNWSKGKTYAEARAGLEKGTGEYVRSGRIIRRITSSLRKQLGIEA
jgi:hypothetical protein